MPGESVEIYKDAFLSRWAKYFYSVRTLESGVKEVEEGATFLTIEPCAIKASADQVAVVVYSLDGRLEAKALLNAGDTLTIPASLHIVTDNGQPLKIVIP